jgi:putative DNA primase/helicase
LLATPSGTVELRTGRLREASREDLLTRRTAVRYDPEARPQAWLEFLRDVCQGQEWMASYLWRALGYGLTGEVGEHCLFFLHGRGRNGKSTLIETVRKVLGEVALVSETDTLMSQDRGGSAIRTDIARLKEARFVAMEETAKAGRFDAGTMKRLTGGTRIVARTVYKPEIEFDPQCKFYVCGNHKPHVTETDDGTWRRIRLIPFEHQIPEGRVDKRMGERLMAEAEGVLAWLIEGARRWYESGLAEPDEVTAAVAEYRDDMDTIGHFLREETRVAPGAATQKKPFYERYKTWAKARNHYVLNIKQLAMDMKDRGFRDKKLESGLHWLDVELVEAGLLEDA